MGVFIFLMRNNAKQSETFNKKFDAINEALSQLEDDFREGQEGTSDRLDKLTTILISVTTDSPGKASEMMNSLTR